MQNLRNCSRRHEVVSKRMFSLALQRDVRKYGMANTRLANIAFKKSLDRLFFPVSYQAYREICKELKVVESLLRPNGSQKVSDLATLGNIRYFGTTPSAGYCSSTGDNPSKEPSSGNSNKNRKNSDEMKLIMQKAFSVILSMYLLAFVLRRIAEKKNPVELTGVSWYEFVHHMLAKGEVKEVIVSPLQGRAIIVVQDGAVIKGQRSLFKRYYMTVPDIKNFEEKVRKAEKSLHIKFEDGVQIIYDRTDENQVNFLRLGLYLLFLWFILSQFGSRNFMNPLDLLSQMKRAKYTLVKPFSSKGVRFDDVAGLKEAKVEVMEFVDYLKHPERYKTLGAKVPKGALLLGPPGCGKTLLAKAVATESNVPFLSMNGSEFIEMLGGLGAARVRDLFKEGRKRAPSIIYIDEIDAIGKKRSKQDVELSNSESERTLNQLLVEMDGMTTVEDIIILASTNRAEVLDKALLRPGRFDRHILIDLPTLEERKQIFEKHLQALVLDSKPAKYSEYLSYLTPGFSGADIANVCNEAALSAARNKKTKVEGSDLMYAIDRTIGGPMKKTNTLTPNTKKVVAYHEAGHALVGWLLEHTNALLKVTIVPRTNMSLGFAQYTESDQKLLSEAELFEQMCMMLGGRVAEYIMFNEISTGAENDLQKVTKTAYHQVQQFGMSSNVGLISFDEEITSTKNKKPYSKKLANLMDAEVRRLIAEAYKSTEKLLRDNKDKLIAVAEALLQKETLTYDDVEKLIGSPPFRKRRLVEPVVFEKSSSKASSPLQEPIGREM